MLALVGAPRVRAQGPRPEGGGPRSSLARLVPAKDLILYAEFDGFDEHAQAWRSSAAYKILNNTKFGALLEDLAAQGIEAAGKGALPAGLGAVKTVSSLERIARSGFILAVNNEGPRQSHTLFAVRDGARPA